MTTAVIIRDAINKDKDSIYEVVSLAFHGEQNIRVNCICPGDTETELLSNEAAQVGQTMDEFLEGASKRPLGRIGMPEDIAKAALYLASEASSFVTGTTLVVDGGGLAG